MFYLRLKKRLSKHSRCRWFKTPSRSLWRHCNACIGSCHKGPVMRKVFWCRQVIMLNSPTDGPNIYFHSASFGNHDDVIKWKHFPRYWPFVRGIHRSPVNSTHKGQWRRALMFSLIRAWINRWVNNREAGDLRRYRAHYDVIVMAYLTLFTSTNNDLKMFIIIRIHDLLFALSRQSWSDFFYPENIYDMHLQMTSKWTCFLVCFMLFGTDKTRYTR